MSVLLFVQTGDARPKCAGSATLEPERRRTTQYSQNMAGYYVSLWAMLARRAADRWWLVECANADEGRTLIYAAELVAAAKRFTGRKDAPACISGKLPEGRILASGGRHA